MQIYDLIVIGGGPSGFFAALSAFDKNPKLNILIVEKGINILSKVLLSGGGRCNLTHACFDPKELIEYYPRGSKELLGPFTKFQPADVIEWFSHRGVKTKTEKDGRVFPTSNKSSTVANCLIRETEKANIKTYKSCQVNSVELHENNFLLTLLDGSFLKSKKLLLATGGNSKSAYQIASNFGHTIIPPVPSLFTFNIKDKRFEDLLGISIPNVEISLEIQHNNKKKSKFIKSGGPLLITHWGISGPAVLKLSSWAARNLNELNYKSKLIINWLPSMTQNKIIDTLSDIKANYPKQLVSKQSIDEAIPSRLWKKLIFSVGIDPLSTWSNVSKLFIQKIAKEINSGVFQIQGKGVFKDEFVTCGGINLSEVNFKTMESKFQSNLYFAGEVLDIDGLTGGFNFQSAWTTGWIAGQSIAQNP